MLPKENRVSSKDLEDLRGSKSIRTKHLLFVYRDSVDGVSHMGCSISKKVAKHAVDRNRLKRHCRHAISDKIDSFPIKVSGLIRILSSETEWEDFVREIEEISNKLNRK